jgi:hypothetical protein
MELGDEDAEVRAFVNDGQDYGNVHGGSVSMMAGGKKRYPRCLNSIALFVGLS